MELVPIVYQVTSKFPSHEIYGLTSQIRRCTVSIPSNIAEGAARHTNKKLINFLHIAQGSLSELDTQLDISLRLEYLSSDDRIRLDAFLVRIDKMLTAFIRAKK